MGCVIEYPCGCALRVSIRKGLVPLMKNSFFRSALCLWLAALLSCAWACAEPLSAEPEKAPRDRMIDEILEAAHDQYVQTGGKLRRAHNAGDIYVCKNFTVYCFKQAAPHYRMAEYPDVALVIPDNLPAKECKPYAYGLKWKEVSAEKGNPFVEAAAFRYDNNLSKAENRELAREFLKQAKRGDFFQMRANYYWGIGAHSMIFTEDYDPATDSVTWCDSNMRGQSKNGIRYGVVQWNAVKEIDWFVDAFCRKQHGATIYRLRDDIIPKP